MWNTPWLHKLVHLSLHVLPYFCSDGKRGQRAPVCKPVPVMHSLDDMPSTSAAGPNSSPLRPWLKTGKDCSLPYVGVFFKSVFLCHLIL